jgi:hypothetical protein
VQAAAAARVEEKFHITDALGDGNFITCDIHWMHYAAENGDVAAVRDFLTADASCVDETDLHGYEWTPPSPACIEELQCL